MFKLSKRSLSRLAGVDEALTEYVAKRKASFPDSNV